jgi:hypothetical protein
MYWPKKRMHETMKMQSYTQNLQCGALFWLSIMSHSLHTVKAALELKKQVLPLLHNMGTNSEEKFL